MLYCYSKIKNRPASKMDVNCEKNQKLLKILLQFFTSELFRLIICF